MNINDLTPEQKDKLIEEAMKARDRRAAYNRKRWALIKTGNHPTMTKEQMYETQKNFRDKKNQKIEELKAEIARLKEQSK